jgi:hypothetical protein
LARNREAGFLLGDTSDPLERDSQVNILVRRYKKAGRVIYEADSP